MPAFFGLLLLAATKNPTIITPNQAEFSVAPQYFAIDRKTVRWVFIGTGHLDKLAPALQKNKISYFVVPWLKAPLHAESDITKFYPEKKMEDPGWTGLAIDGRYYRTARKLFAKAVESNDCVLADFSEKPTIYFPGPMDKDLISNFKSHRSAFDSLAKLFRHDNKLQRVGETFTVPEDPASIGVNSRRIANYRALLTKIGALEGLAHFSEEYLILSWTFGVTTSAEYSKGYCYLVRPPKKLSKSLDMYEPTGKERTEDYRHIEGNWYIYADYVP